MRPITMMAANHAGGTTQTVTLAPAKPAPVAQEIQDEPWRKISAQKQKEREERLWPSARVDHTKLNKPLNISSLASSSGLLTAAELEIIELTATELARHIAKGQYTAVAVVTAYIKAATIAQDSVNCLTEICYEAGLQRAKELDEIYAREGKTVGPLHGVPVSIKDHVNVKGMDGASGFVGWCYNRIAEKDAVAVRCLREAGAVLYTKTSNPQSLLAIETNNNVYGRTLNPYNRNLSAGGSTGGEGALLAMKGSPLGLGTDIAGSIRIPALWNGVYGLKPSVGRLPHTGLQGPHDGMDTIMGVVGPLARSAQDLELFCSAILDREPWHIEAQLIAKPWVMPRLPPSRKLTIAIMRDDSLCAPHPPVSAALDSAISRLQAAGHRIVEWDPIRAAESEMLSFTLMLQDQGDEYRDHLALSGEPPVPTIDWLLKEKAPAKSVDHPYGLWELVRQREKLRQDAVDQWQSFDHLDVILCPGAPTLAPPHDTSRHWGYTAMWNVLDWPAVTFPCQNLLSSSASSSHHASSNGHTAWPPHAPRSEVEKFVHSSWDPEAFKDAPVGLQVVGRRLEEEKLLEDLEVIEACLRA